MLKIKALTFATGQTVIRAPLASTRHCQTCRAGMGADGQELWGQGCILPSCKDILHLLPLTKAPRRPPCPRAQACTYAGVGFQPRK